MNTKIYLQLALILATFTTPLLAADGPPANSESALSESFDSAELSSKWHINAGQWKVTDGVLRVRELAADKHAAAARHALESKNAVYQLRFRFVDGGKAFHLGFDPAPGELDKRGHLFSVVITPNSWKILKHADKKRPQEDPNETLAKADIEAEPGTWHELRVSTWENFVTAKIDGTEVLKASHPTFAVKKPTLVFRCQGDGVEIDDIQVWRQVR
jgi:hypothetical protein